MAMSEAWMARAACRGSTDLFFAERGDAYAVVRARRICDRCPVWSECLDYAVSDIAPDHGVLAGMTPKERSQLRRDCRTTAVPVRVNWRTASPGGMPWLLSANEPLMTAWTRGELLAFRAAVDRAG